jgi:small-conductance mechanosensitive channel
MTEIIRNWEEIAWSAAYIGIAILIGLTIHYILFQIIRQIAKRTALVLDKSIYKHCRQPLRLIFPLIAIRISVPLLPYDFSADVSRGIELAVSVILIVACAWLVIRVLNVVEDFILDRYNIDVEDNLSARKVYTQMDIIRKIVVFVIAVVTLAAVLMNFENFRQIGTSILASAGLAGLIIGFAAQRTIANILAGIQIALTQPIRIDDVVIVENEWGRIEEITLTYVVVCIWDLRRLVLPISYFIEQPFQNWTRVSADILGTVFLYVDYTVPIDEIRKELGSILKESEYWDGNVWRLHTTEAKERTVELRALMSAGDSGSAWELRCEVREKLIEFVRNRYPDALPKFRAELQNPAESASPKIPRKKGSRVKTVS